jgi:hypothetical protein
MWAACAARSAFRQRLVAIQYGQARNDARLSKVSRPSHAASSDLLHLVLGILKRAEDPVSVTL